MNNTARFKFIEAMILRYGEVKKVHIQRCFDVSSPTATRILANYKTENKDSIYCDHKDKTYKATDSFVTKFLDYDADEFLNAAQLMSNQLIIQTRTVMA